MNHRNQVRLILALLGTAMYGWAVVYPANMHVECVADAIKSIMAMAGLILVISVIMDIDTTSMKD